MAGSNLCSLTIAQAHQKLKAKEISSVDLVQSCIDRIDSVDGKLNAVVYKNFEKALDKAKKVDSDGVFDHPLTGIPYLAKDVFCEKGVPTTACSNVLRNKDYIPPYSSTITQRLNHVNAISLGKANTDDFTMGGSTETSCYGVTKNPWDTKRVAGGSSGGSSAAVAADECLFALGTDTGGSIRLPSAYCSCVGMRNTYGRTSRFGTMPMASSLDTTGALAKSVEDLAHILSTIAGHDPKDSTTSTTPVPDYVAKLSGNMQGLTIGLPHEYFVDGLDAEIENAVRNAVACIKDLGATVQDISLPHTQYAVPTYYVIVPSEVSSNSARYDGIRYGHTVENPTNLVDYYERVRTEGFGDEVKRRIMIGTYALSAGYYDAYYRKAQKVRTLIKKDFEDAFQHVDLIVSPVTPTPAYTVGAHEGDPVAMYLEDIFMCSQALAGIPAISVPCGFTKDNLPIGLQIMGPQWGEETILQAAHAYEQATNWHTQKALL